MDTGQFHGSLFSHTLAALRRVGAVLVRERGRCDGYGPLFVQRDAKRGEGLPHAPEPGDGISVFRPRESSGKGLAWLEVWNVAGRSVPIVPVPAPLARWLRQQRRHHLGDLPMSKDVSTLAKPFDPLS